MLFPETVHLQKIKHFLIVLNVILAYTDDLIRMKNNYELQNDFVFVFSLARTSTTFSRYIAKQYRWRYIA